MWKMTRHNDLFLPNFGGKRFFNSVVRIVLKDSSINNFMEVFLMTNLIKKLWYGEEGQGMTEYGLIIALVALAVVTVLGLMGDDIAAKFEAIRTELQ